jgi:hypothetical protein
MEHPKIHALQPAQDNRTIAQASTKHRLNWSERLGEKLPNQCNSDRFTVAQNIST